MPHAARARFFGAVAAAFVGFAVAGLFTSLAPSFLAGTLHQPSHLLAGLAAFLSFAAAALAQMLLARLSARRQIVAGLGSVIPGVVLVTGAVWQPSLAVFLTAGWSGRGLRDTMNRYPDRESIVEALAHQRA